MAGYWQSSFFACLWTETESRSINTQKKLVISLWHKRFVKAFIVLADLSAVGNFPHSLGPK